LVKPRQVKIEVVEAPGPIGCVEPLEPAFDVLECLDHFVSAGVGFEVARAPLGHAFGVESPQVVEVMFEGGTDQVGVFGEVIGLGQAPHGQVASDRCHPGEVLEKGGV
jgi:hypothetical protein